MKQFKALILKEWRTHWGVMLTPAWLTAGVLLITLVGFIIAWANGLPMNGGNAEQYMKMAGEYRSLILWAANVFGATMLGFAAFLVMISLPDLLLNSGFKRKCEIFHLSQPVGMSKILFSKYLFMVLGTYIQIILIALVFGTLASLYVNRFVGGDFSYVYNGLALGLIGRFLPLVFLGSLAWFFAALNRKNYLLMAVAIFIGIEIAVRLINFQTGSHIPSINAYIFKLSGMGINMSSNPLPGLTGSNTT
ncbi:MAG TPA: hypothetical protein PLX59_07335, partial [Candidatus Cloacimonadota bacterium]|nr:hypothetical protein [Candidatus Cloacimonadota bacterium]